MLVLLFLTSAALSVLFDVPILMAADILARTLESLDLHYPKVDEKKLAEFGEIRQRLLAE